VLGKFDLATTQRGQPVKVTCKLDQKVPFEGKASVELLGLPNRRSEIARRRSRSFAPITHLLHSGFRCTGWVRKGDEDDLMPTSVMSGAGATGIHAPTVQLGGQSKIEATGQTRSLRARAVRFIGRSFLSMPPSTWLLFDISVLVVAVQVSYSAFTLYELPETPHLALWQASAVFAFAVIVASLVFGLYERETLTGRSHVLARMFATVACAAVIAYAIIYVIMYATVSRRSAALTLAIFFVTGSSVRLLAIADRCPVHQILCGTPTIETLVEG